MNPPNAYTSASALVRDWYSFVAAGLDLAASKGRRWRCKSCHSTWLYSELSALGYCPSCDGIVVMEAYHG